MAKRKGSPAPSSSRARKKVDRDAREAVDAQILLDKLPPEVWEKILDELDENDLFPLALSCKYFRQKQRELVARTGRGRQSGRKSGLARLALKTTLRNDPPENGQPASADYLRFCSKEKTSNDYYRKKDTRIQCLAAFHGHLPLMQELQAGLKTLDYGITGDAGESPFFSQSLLLFVALGSDSFLSSPQRREGNWRPCSG